MGAGGAGVAGDSSAKSQPARAASSRNNARSASRQGWKARWAPSVSRATACPEGARPVVTGGVCRNHHFRLVVKNPETLKVPLSVNHPVRIILHPHIILNPEIYESQGHFLLRVGASGVSGRHILRQAVARRMLLHINSKCNRNLQNDDQRIGVQRGTVILRKLRGCRRAGQPGLRRLRAAGG